VTPLHRSTKMRILRIVSTPSELSCLGCRTVAFFSPPLTPALRFEFKGKDPKFRIETPSRVIHSLKTPVSQEITGMQKLQIKSAILRVVKRFGTSPPPHVRVPFIQRLLDDFDALTRMRFRNCFPLSNKSFSDGVRLRKRSVAVSLHACCCSCQFVFTRILLC
jgi:hypothetical protein